MPRFLVDTDVLIDHLREGVRVPVPPADTAYSTITRAELYAGRDTDERVIDTLLDAFEEIPVDRRIAESAG
ncbi:MAG: type II toxin-antitoxin system VapC family toxin, partial [Actinomycetota bacterium]